MQARAVPIFWRVFAVNAGLLALIAVLLLLSPVEISYPIKPIQAPYEPNFPITIRNLMRAKSTVPAVSPAIAVDTGIFGGMAVTVVTADFGVRR